MNYQLTQRWYRTVLLSVPFFLLVRVLYLAVSTPKVDGWNINTQPASPPQRHLDEVDPKHLTKAIVVASLSKNDNSWLLEQFPDWKTYAYIMDANSTASQSLYTVPANAGGESMAYLTYIIDHYDHLPDYTVFIHAGRYQWHNEDPMYDAVPVLKNLQLSYVQQVGYVNLRCTWTLGCPKGMQPFHRTIVTDLKDLFFKLVPSWPDDAARTQTFYQTAFRQLLPDMPVPTAIALPCCNQFALTRWKIRERPRDDYVRYRQWLIDCPYGREISGRVLEYTWHIIMGMPAVFCHDAKYCFCAKFGLCDLNCTVGECDGRYIYPPTTAMPLGWPEQGPGENGWPARDWYLTATEST